MTFTKAERDRIRLWLLKSPKSDDKNKNLFFIKDDGTEVHLSRNTVYSDNQKWKIRFAYHVDTGMFTGDTSGPIPGGQDTKDNQKVKHAMTEKFGPKKSPGITFSKVVDEQIKKVYATAWINQVKAPLIWELGKEGYVESKSNASGNVGGGGSFQDMAESETAYPSAGYGDYGTELVDSELPEDNTIW